MPLTVVNWNVAWGEPEWVRPIILQRIFEHEPEVLCLTETDDGFLNRYGGYTIRPKCDFGPGLDGLRRKVLLWSRTPWESVDQKGAPQLPPGRFVSGTTDTSIGPITLYGVCVPFHNSRIKQGKKSWQDHEGYLDLLADILKNTASAPAIVVGDFNHQIGQRRYPYPPANHRVRPLLASAMDAGSLTIATAALGFHGAKSVRRAIDHIAINHHMCAASLGVISNAVKNPQDLSDHFGVFATLNLQTPQKSNHSKE